MSKLFATHGILRSNGKVLLVHRTKDNTIAFPGGKIDKGELPLQALVRETKEELNIDISKAMKVQKMVSVSKNGKRFILYVIDTNINPNDIKVKPDEIKEVLFVSEKELLNNYINQLHPIAKAQVLKLYQ
jgi:8-oxo-dGTP pyrophosphatase MutT (NUDIX family)